MCAIEWRRLSRVLGLRARPSLFFPITRGRRFALPSARSPNIYILPRFYRRRRRRPNLSTGYSARLRLIRHLGDVIRPADPRGCICRRLAGALMAPTLLSRKTCPCYDIDAKLRRQGVPTRRLYCQRETVLELIILSCGSQLQHALAAAEELGASIRVVLMPCMERFNRESE